MIVIVPVGSHFGRPSFRGAGHEDIPPRVAADPAYQNARIEHDKALARVMTAVLKDYTELFEQFMDNPSFRRWMADTVFGLTYDDAA